MRRRMFVKAQLECRVFPDCSKEIVSWVKKDLPVGLIWTLRLPGLCSMHTRLAGPTISGKCYMYRDGCSEAVY